MRIRHEQVEDIPTVRKVLYHAYNEHPYTEVTEHRMLDALRETNCNVLTLVAEDPDEGIIGALTVSPVTVNDESCGWFMVGPVGVLPEHQRKGVGSALLSRAVRSMDSMGAEGLVLTGAPSYFRRFGFKNDTRLSMKEIQPEKVLILSLGETVPSGEVKLHPCYYEGNVVI